MRRPSGDHAGGPLFRIVTRRGVPFANPVAESTGRIQTYLPRRPSAGAVYATKRPSGDQLAALAVVGTPAIRSQDRVVRSYRTNPDMFEAPTRNRPFFDRSPRSIQSL